MNEKESILLAGGSGVVGGQAAELIRLRHPNLPLLIGGRDLKKAGQVALGLKNAEPIELDIEKPQPLRGLRPRVVVALVNDPQDFLLLDAVGAGIPFLDIARWTVRMKATVSLLSALSLRAPVLLSSAWMAGTAALAAAAAMKGLKSVNRVDINILYSLSDKAGPNSAEYMDRLAVPFEIRREGRQVLALPLTDPVRVSFPGGFTTRTYRLDTPDQFTLPTVTGAATVSSRIAFDKASATRLLVFLARSGIWKLTSGDRFTALRRSLLYNPGAGGRHELLIEVAGTDDYGAPKTRRVEIVDPLGQTHLTALGVLIQVERLLGLDGAAPPEPQIVYPESSPRLDRALGLLREYGVSVDVN